VGDKFKVDDIVQFSMPKTGRTRGVPDGTRGVVTEVQSGACVVHFENEVTRTILNEFLTRVGPKHPQRDD